MQAAEPPAAAQQERADLYALVGALLLAAEEPLLAALAEAPAWPPEAEPRLRQCWGQLTRAAARCRTTARDEFARLFVATGNPLLNPDQSYYLAGCLMDKPLAALRSDLRELGLARPEGVRELEDHLGALCEAMRLLVLRAEPCVQREFFRKHLAGWSAACLADLRAAAGADFYRAVADFAEAFLALEQQALAIDASDCEAILAGPRIPIEPHARLHA